MAKVGFVSSRRERGRALFELRFEFAFEFELGRKCSAQRLHRAYSTTRLRTSRLPRTYSTARLRTSRLAGLSAIERVGLSIVGAMPLRKSVLKVAEYCARSGGVYCDAWVEAAYANASGGRLQDAAFMSAQA